MDTIFIGNIIIGVIIILLIYAALAGDPVETQAIKTPTPMLPKHMPPTAPPKPMPPTAAVQKPLVVTSAPVILQATTVLRATPEYIGCYLDEPDRALPVFKGRLTVDECNKVAKEAGSPYFGMQFWPGETNIISDTADCWIGDSELTLAKTQRYGVTTDCATGTDDKLYGGGFANAIYATV